MLPPCVRDRAFRQRPPPTAPSVRWLWLMPLALLACDESRLKIHVNPDGGVAEDGGGAGSGDGPGSTGADVPGGVTGDGPSAPDAPPEMDTAPPVLCGN